MKALFKKPNMEAEVIELKDELSEYQELVCGGIECVHMSNNRDLIMIVNDEGKLIGLDDNIKYGTDTLNGNILVVGDDYENESFRGLTDIEIQQTNKYFKDNYIDKEKPICELVFL